MGRTRANGEGTLYRDPARNRWIGAIHIDGRRRKVTGKTKTEANRRLRELISAAERGDQIGDGNATVGDALDLWERRVLAGRDLAPATAELYRWCVSLLRTELGSKRLRTLSPDDVEAALDRLALDRRDGRPLGRSALTKLRSVLGQALDTAQRRGLVSRNVARMAELTPAAKRPEARRSLTAAEARQLRRQLDHERLGAMFLLMLTTGVRPGEAAGVLWDDLDLDAATVTVRHAVRVERNRPVVVDQLKTTGSHRTLALPAATVAALRAHKTAQAAERLAAATWADDRLVFATRNGTALSPANVRRELRQVCERAGVPELRPNELRHTAASLMSDAGVPLEQVADVLGHTSTRMLDATYRHRVRPSVDAAVAVMDGLLGDAAS